MKEQRLITQYIANLIVSLHLTYVSIATYFIDKTFQSTVGIAKNQSSFLQALLTTWYTYVCMSTRDATIYRYIAIIIVIHWAVILYRYTFRLYRYIEYRDVSPSKCTLIHTTDAVVVHYACEFYTFATIFHLYFIKKF